MSNMRINNIDVVNKYIKMNYTKGFVIKRNFVIIHSVDASCFYSIDSYIRHVSMNEKAKESVHYVVSDNEIVNLLEDNLRALHVKGSKVKEVNNSTAIGVAIILRDNMDTEKVFNNLVKLIRALITKYKIDLKNVLRHSDVSDTECPKEFNEDYIWHNFKLSVAGIKDIEKPIGRGEIYNVLSKLNVKAAPSDESEVISVIENGSKFYVYEDLGDWVRIAAEVGRTVSIGYLYKDFIQYEELSGSQSVGEEAESINSIDKAIEFPVEEREIEKVNEKEIEFKDDTEISMVEQEITIENYEINLPEKEILEDLIIEEYEVDLFEDEVLEESEETVIEESFSEKDIELDGVIRRDDFGNIIKEDLEKIKKSKYKSKIVLSNDSEEDKVISAVATARVTVDDLYLNRDRKLSTDKKKSIIVDDKKKEKAKKIVKERLDTIVSEKAEEIKKSLINEVRLGSVCGANMNLQVRKEPSDESFVSAYLLNGQNVKIISQKNEWYEIEYYTMYEKRRGFVQKKYIKLL